VLLNRVLCANLNVQLYL